MNYTNTFFFSRLRRIRVTNIGNVENFLKGEKMKTKLIFLALAVLIFQTANVFAVENTVATVEKQYQHELICQASTETEDFELNLKWSVEYMHVPDGRAPLIKKEFKFELSNLTAGTSIQDTYGNFFGEHADIKATDEALHAVGSLFFYKRLGYIQKKTDILLDHDGAGNYYLNYFVNKSIDSYENPKDYCNPPTRLCGSEPPFPSKTTVTSHKFVTSTCQLKK
jgi:hypothetical protein